MQEWRPVKGFESLYEVSNDGAVKSIGRYVNSRWGKTWLGPHMMTLQKSKKGYFTVVLHSDGQHYTKQVHRLVAEAFIPNVNNLEQVNHKDTNKTNNNVSNLEWVTPEENIRHAFKNGCFHRTERQAEHARAAQKECAKNKRKCVGMFSQDGELLCIFRSVSDAEKISGVNSSKVCSVCGGNRKTAGGYIWKYMEEV